ncbi:MAG: neutral/alkaline non-lysosomal ceramidase N-terminal domain-containing protein [Pseudomonadales bacterium]
MQGVSTGVLVKPPPANISGKTVRVLLYLMFIMGSSLIMAGEFEAGFSKVAITPVAHKDVVDTLQSGPKTVGDISDPIYARALILSDGLSRIAFISLDLMFIPSMVYAELLEGLREQSSFNQIFLSITHSHSGYVGNNNYGALKGKIVSAIEAAGAKLQAVKIGASEGTLDEAYNRIVRHTDDSVEMLWTNPARKPNRSVDQSVGVINLQKINGETLVNIVNYSAHPVVTMDLNNVVVSADYPGQLANSLKQQGEGETLFVLGAAGDVNPYDADTKPTALSLEKSNQLGERLAAEVIEIVRGINNYQAHGNFSFDNLRYVLPVIFEPSDIDAVPAEINTLILTDNIALASFSGEFFNEFGERIKLQSPINHTFFLGYTNGSLGYMPTLEAVQFGGYGATAGELWVDNKTGESQINDAIESLQTQYQIRSGILSSEPGP